MNISCVFVVNFLKIHLYEKELDVGCQVSAIIKAYLGNLSGKKTCLILHIGNLFLKDTCTCICRVINMPTKLPVLGYTACYTLGRTMTSPSVSRRGRRGSPPRGWPAGLTSTASLTESSTPSTSDKSWLTFYTIPHPCK